MGAPNEYSFSCLRKNVFRSLPDQRRVERGHTWRFSLSQIRLQIGGPGRYSSKGVLRDMVRRRSCKFVGLLCLLITLARATTPPKCNPWERVELSNATLLSDGSAWDGESWTLYPAGTHWREEREGGDSGAVFGCPCRSDKPCLRKCCLKDQAMDNDTLECIPFDEPWPWFRPSVPIDANGTMVEVDRDHFALAYGIHCRGYVVEPEFYPDTDQFYLNLTDGTLTLFQKKKFGLRIDEFCLEYFPATDEYLPFKCFRRLGMEKREVGDLGMCYHVRYLLYPIAFAVSIFFLLISLLVYGILPDLRNMHGKCLICHMISVLVAYIGLAAVQALGSEFSDDVCVTFGFAIYFAVLCTFFWLNIMCIDIFLAFRGMQPARGNAQQRKKFLWYVAYAWGLPFILLMIALFMEFYPDLPDWVLRPQFKDNCWIKETSKLVYFIIPVGFIVSCNTLLFLTTACTISRVRRETEVLRKGESKRHDHRHDQHEEKARFKLYAKLSVVMGISWAMEIVSFAVGGSVCYWIFTDLINILQGVFIFLIFVCKRKVKDMIIKRFCPSLASRKWSLVGNASLSWRTTESTQRSSVSSTVATSAQGTQRDSVVSLQKRDF